MKNSASLALCAALALGFAACGGSDDDDDSPQVPDAGQTDAGATGTDAGTADASTPPAGKGRLHISQVYFGGFQENSSAYDAEFIEFVNAGGADVDMADYTLVYGGKKGNPKTYSFYRDCGGGKCVVKPGGRFVAKTDDADAVDASTKKLAFDVDMKGAINIGQNGSFAIMPQGIPSDPDCDKLKAIADDILGVGENAWCWEGSGTATGVTTENRHQKAYVRKGSGMTDTDDNAADFQVESPSVGQ